MTLGFENLQVLINLRSEEEREEGAELLKVNALAAGMPTWLFLGDQCGRDLIYAEEYKLSECHVRMMAVNWTLQVIPHCQIST